MPAIALSKFRSKFLVLYKPPQRSQATYGQMSHILDLVAGIEKPKIRTTAHFTQEMVAAYVCRRSEAVCANTIVGELGYLKAACTWAEEESFVERSPFRGKRKSTRSWIRPEPPRQQPWHSMESMVRLFESLSGNVDDWIGHRLYALSLLVALTGVRRDEALYTQVADIDWAYPVLRVMGRRRLKTIASAAPVPIPDQLAEALRSWVPRTDSIWLFPGIRRLGPWDQASCGYRPLDRLAAAGEAVGIKGLTFQSLRHSWATHAESAWGITEPVIQRCLRHTSPFTSQIYRHADLANLAAATRAIGYRRTP
jgi:integrase